MKKSILYYSQMFLFIILRLLYIITIIFLIFSIINIKFAFIENFFDFINKGYYFDIATIPHVFKSTVFAERILYNSQDIYYYILIFSIVNFIFFLFCCLIKNNKNIYYIDIFLSLFLYGFFYYFIISKNSIILLITLILIFINILFLVLQIKINIPKIFFYIPYLSDIFLSFNLYNVNIKLKKYIIFVNTLILLNFIFLLFPIEIYCNNMLSREPMFGIENITNKSKIIAKVYEKERILVVDKNFNINTYDFFKLSQDIIYNSKKEEIYVYAPENGNFYVLDSNNLRIKKMKNIWDVNYKINPCPKERIAFDNQSNTILIILEFDGFILLDQDSLEIKYKKEILDKNRFNDYSCFVSNDLTIAFGKTSYDDVVFNKYRNSYIITSWFFNDKLIEFNLKDYSINYIDAYVHQGGICISDQNKEVYIAFYMKNFIGVYDAETMKLKRKIRTLYTAKNIMYDKDLNVLIAPGYHSRTIDIFLMDGSDKLLVRKKINIFGIRDVKFDTTKKFLYISSKVGLCVEEINIKQLIHSYLEKKHKNG